MKVVYLYVAIAFVLLFFVQPITNIIAGVFLLATCYEIGRMNKKHRK